MRAERIGQFTQPEKTDGFNRGFLASYAIYTTMKTLPDGRVVHTYSEADRKKAHSRLIIGVVMLVLLLLFTLVRAFR